MLNFMKVTYEIEFKVICYKCKRKAKLRECFEFPLTMIIIDVI